MAHLLLPTSVDCLQWSSPFLQVRQHEENQVKGWRLKKMKTATSPKGRDGQSESSAAKMSRRRDSSERQYEEVAVIGNGAYGTVYKARDLRNDGKFVAMKRIRLCNTEEGMPMTAIREISMLKQLEKYEHPNVVKWVLWTVCDTENSTLV